MGSFAKWQEFSSPNWQGNSELSLCRNEYVGTNVDSIKTVGANTVFYHSDILRKTPETTDCPLFKRSTNWIGPKTIIKPTGENIFLNNAGDSIRLNAKAAINDKWHLCDFSNGSYFEAELINAYYGPVFYLSDSIKVISLTLKDNNNNTIPHNFNGKQILLSEHVGIVKAYDFSRFPMDTAAFILQGSYSPKFGVRDFFANEIFDYNVGDEFHIEENHSAPSVSGSFVKERRIILEKNRSSNLDTLTYKVERVLIGDYYEWQNTTPVTTTLKDTIIEKIVISDYPFLNKWHYALPANASGNLFTLNCLQKSIYNNRLAKTSTIGLYSNDNICFNIVMDYPNPAPIYIEGLGYYYEGLVNMGEQYHRRPVYFKKGSETWGTPVEFDLLLSTTSRKNYQLNSSVSPNPFTDFTVLKISNPNKESYELILLDVYGKTVGQYSIDGEELIIRNDGNLKGQYFYKIYNDQDAVGSGKLIVY